MTFTILISNIIDAKLKCPDYGGVLISDGVVLCTDFNGGPGDVSLLERCPLSGISFIRLHTTHVDVPPAVSSQR